MNLKIWKIRKKDELRSATYHLGIIKKVAEELNKIEYDQEDPISVWRAIEKCRYEIDKLPGLISSARMFYALYEKMDELIDEIENEEDEQ